MLLLGALTNTNPVVDGFVVFDLSLVNFASVLGNPNVHYALMNSLIACAGEGNLDILLPILEDAHGQGITLAGQVQDKVLAGQFDGTQG